MPKICSILKYIGQHKGKYRSGLIEFKIKFHRWKAAHNFLTVSSALPSHVPWFSIILIIIRQVHLRVSQQSKHEKTLNQLTQMQNYHRTACRKLIQNLPFEFPNRAVKIVLSTIIIKISNSDCFPVSFPTSTTDLIPISNTTTTIKPTKEKS